jgi:hypothetical protein
MEQSRGPNPWTLTTALIAEAYGLEPSEHGVADSNPARNMYVRSHYVYLGVFPWTDTPFKDSYWLNEELVHN